MKTALCSIAFKDRTLQDVLDLASTAGFDGVEPWGRPPHIPEPYDSDGMRGLAEAIEIRGLVVSQYGSYANPSKEDFEQSSRDALRAAADLNTDTIRVWAGNTGSADASDADWQTATDGLRWFADQALGSGIRLVLEMHNGYLSDSAEGCVRLVEGVDRENLLLNYQPNYLHDVERVIEEARTVAPFVAAAHAQNYVSTGSNKRSLVSDGFVDYHTVVGILRAAGFDGFLEVEFVREEGPEAALAQDAAFLRSLCSDG